MGFGRYWSQGKQAKAMSFRVQGDQATYFQLMPMVFQNAQDGISHDLGSGAIDTELDDAWKSCTLQSENACEIQILCENDRLVGGGVFEKGFIRVPGFADIGPMSGLDIKCGEKVPPPRRQVFVHNEDHEAISS